MRKKRDSLVQRSIQPMLLRSDFNNNHISHRETEWKRKTGHHLLYSPPEWAAGTGVSSKWTPLGRMAKRSLITACTMRTGPDLIMRSLSSGNILQINSKRLSLLKWKDGWMLIMYIRNCQIFRCPFHRTL